MRTLRTKLVSSYIFIALFIAAAFSICFNVFLQKAFMNYAVNRQEKQVELIVQQVNQSLQRDVTGYTQELLEVIGNSALQNGMILHINTNGGEVDWDIRQHYFEQCKLALEHAKYNMHSVNPNLDGAYQEETFSLNGGAATVTIGFYGPYNYDDEEVLLIGMINRILIGITVTSLILAVAFAAVMTHRLSLPISDVIATTRRISKGEWGIQASSKSNTREICDLVESVNEMSGKLGRIEEMKRRLTSDVAHELRTPLANLLGQTEAMVDGILSPDPERLQGFYDEIERITQIVNNLQKLTDIEEETIALHQEYFQVWPLFQSVREAFHLELRKKNINMLCECDPALGVTADHDRMTQVFTNLVSNAVKYTPENGHIVMEAHAYEGRVCFSVKDTGSGIPLEDIPFVFERFYRADKSRTRSTGGAGIGLAIAKALVNAHGGNISVYSKVGIGTKFEFFIPT